MSRLKLLLAGIVFTGETILRYDRAEHLWAGRHREREQIEGFPGDFVAALLTGPGTNPVKAAGTGSAA